MDVKGLVRLGECNDVIVIGSITLDPKVVVRSNRPQTQIARRDREEARYTTSFRFLRTLRTLPRSSPVALSSFVRYHTHMGVDSASLPATLFSFFNEHHEERV